MNKRKQLVVGLSAVMTLYAACMTVCTIRLQTRLARMEATQEALLEQHRCMKQGLMNLAQSSDLGVQTFRKVLAVLDAEDGVDIYSFPVIESNARGNLEPIMPGK
jgi:hypothetical protein